MEQRGVGDTAGEHPVDRQTVPHPRLWRHRHAATLRLEPEQPAPGGRNPDRAGAVGAERRADEAGRDRRGAPAARAAGGALQIPRVARRAVGERLGERPQRQLRDVRLADHDRSGLAQQAHHLGVGGRGLVVGVCPVRGQLARHVDVVLHRDRHAEQRALAAGCAPRVRLTGFQARALGEDDAERVQVSVVAFDPAEVDLDELRGGDLTRRDQLRLTCDSGVGELVGVHLAGNLVETAARDADTHARTRQA